MKIKQLLTKRFIKGQNYAQPIIYEWEDVIAQVFSVPVVRYSIIYKIIDRLGLHLSFLPLFKDSFRFVVNGRDFDEPMNSKHVIPCIIDFFERENQLQDFYEKHSRNKLILVSSPFDQQYLMKNHCPLRVELLPYSISDKYKIANNVEKKYDVVLTGRQDPLLYSFFKKYIIEHPTISYVKRGKDLENDDKKTKDYYINGKECIGSISTREEFIKLQSQGKITLYSVQGFDKGYTNGFYHMTPHFLEIIASASHVIAHYPAGEEGIDAQFYEFDKFSPSVETYEQFEIAMDKALSTEVDVRMYSDYLSKHYTSVRAKQLEELLNNL